MLLPSRPIKLILYQNAGPNEVHSIWVNQQTSYGDVSKELATMNPSQSFAVLQPIWGPSPHWIEAEPHSLIEIKCQVIYVVAILDGMRYILGVVRASYQDYPVPIFESVQENSLTVSKAIVELYPELAGRIQSITGYASNVDMADAQCSYDSLKKYQSITSPVIVITVEDASEEFLDDLSDVPIPAILQIPLASCKMLLQRAYDLDSFPLQMIHLSSGILHLIVSLAKRMEKWFEISAPDVDTFLDAGSDLSDIVRVSPIIIREIEELLDTTNRVMDSVESGDYPLKETQEAIESLFGALCGEYPGAVTIRHSYDTFQQLVRADHEEAVGGIMDQTQGHPGPEHADNILTHDLFPRAAPNIGTTHKEITTDYERDRNWILGTAGYNYQQAQVHNRDRTLTRESASREESGNLGTNPFTFSAQAPQVLSGGSRTGGQQYAQQPNMLTTKPPAQKAPPLKRQRVQYPGEESEPSDSYNEVSGQQTEPSGAKGGGQTRRSLGACIRCRLLRMKCVFPEGQTDCCQRCRNSGRASQCVVGHHRPRQPSNTKELLLQKVREQEIVIKSRDAAIKSVLKQVQNPHVRISLRDSPSTASGGAIQDTPHEEKPIDKAILEWITRAQESLKNTLGYRLDGRLLDSDSSDESSKFGKRLGGRDAMSPNSSGTSYGGHSSGRLADPDATGSLNSIKGWPKLQYGSLHHSQSATWISTWNASTGPPSPSPYYQPRTVQPASRWASSRGVRSGAGDSSAGGGGEEDDGAIGVAGPGYFQPAPTSHTGLTPNMLDRKNIPEIMTSGLISPTEVDKLFKIYFDRLNVFISVLDPILHTPATTLGRCPFLFTVVCAIASRYHTERPELYSVAMHFAKRAAASMLIHAEKSVESCQAYILMSAYSMPSRRWEDAREWLYLGLALQMATDLNLHVRSTTKPLNEHHERELLNRTRTWFNLYNFDRSTSILFGRPASIRPDPIVRSCKEQGKLQAWWKSSPFNDPLDLHLCAYTDLMSSIMTEFQDRVYWDPETETIDLRTNLDLIEIAFRYDDKLQAWKAETAISFATHSDSSSPQCAYRVQLLPFYVNYLRLVMLSLGFQQAMQNGATNLDPELVKRCLDAACGVIKSVVEDLAPTDYLRFAPDEHFVFSSFASAFLIKMLRPEHATLLDAEQRTYIVHLVERLVDTLRSPRIAIDIHHTPMLYSHLLARLVKYKPSENTEMVDASATDMVSLPTHPPAKKSKMPDLLAGQNFNTMSRVSRHKQNPSIEVSPRAPDPASQHGTQDTTVTEGTLAPMLAIDAPEFWSSVMLPGFRWPAEDTMNVDESSDSQLFDATG